MGSLRIYENYTVKENVEYINKLLQNGLTMREIEEKHFNVSDRVIVKRLNRKGYKRSSKGNRLFVLIDNNKADIEPNNTNKCTNDKRLQSNYKSNELQYNYNSSVDMKKLLELIDLLEPLKELLKKNELESNVIDVSLEELKVIKVNDPKVRSFKIDNSTLQKWDKFTKEHDLYSVMDLVNTALIEFIERHSKR